jgi:hypothetical protein
MIIEHLTVVLDLNFIGDFSCYFSIETTTSLTRPLNISILGLKVVVWTTFFLFLLDFLDFVLISFTC